MIKLDAPLTAVRIAPRFLAKLKKLEIETVRDLVFHFPTRYEDFSKISPIAELKAGEQAVVRGTVEDIALKRTWKRRMLLVEAVIGDNTGSVQAVWFNQPYVTNVLRKGREANFAGKAVYAENGLCLTNPVYELVDGARFTETKHTGRLVPIYPETRGLTSKGIRYLMKPILNNLQRIPDFIPFFILKEKSLPEVNAALKKVHFPATAEEALAAKRRFAFEDLFLLQMHNLIQRAKLAQSQAVALQTDIEWLKGVIAGLPFEMTFSQKRSLWEIIQDLAKGRPMNRLLQGDVGSGKTIVAALAALVAAKNGCQTAFMAPTEILARQHYQTLLKFFPKFEGGAALLTGSESKCFYGENLGESSLEKSDLREEIRKGTVKIIIGTHALIQKEVEFKNLAYVVVDEQHRFGVHQRAQLVRRQTQTNTQTNTQTDADETQINDKFLYKDITYDIRAAVFNARKNLGLGHKENIYQKALEEEFIGLGLNFVKEKQINIKYNDKNIGIYRPDFVVEDKIIVELKALPFIGTIEEKQIWNYLKGTEYRLALLINFSPQDIQIKRIVYDTARLPHISASSPRQSAFIPHFLSMSATPIPRTLSLTVFGDLDLSIIDELPKDRKPIITQVVPPANRGKAYQFIRKQIQAGRQAFVICPRIEPEDKDESRIMNYELSRLELKSVKEEYEKLSKKIFPDLKVAMLHGRLKPKEKERIMKDFYEKHYDILVATSVVEVGVDVPNATIMMIEGAERFGLAQLYQFRGRVGRGEHQSYCMLFTDSSAKSTHQRLKSIVEAKNGLELAEKDLAIRGPGEFLGEHQTGMPDIAMKALKNPDLVKASREAAVRLMQENPSLQKYPGLRSRLALFQKSVHLE